jgi:hypothetical protein
MKKGDKSGLFKNKKAQVWVETVIYTLVALTIIGLFLSFAKPKIEEIQDKASVEQSIQMLEDINSIILSIVEGGAGNQRVIDLGIKKGSLIINGNEDKIIFEMDGKYTYTEPGANGTQGKYINVGNILATTKKTGKVSTVTLISNYSNIYNITYQGEDKIKVVSRSSAPYKISLSNKGESGGINQIDISLV